MHDPPALNGPNMTKHEQTVTNRKNQLFCILGNPQSHVVKKQRKALKDFARSLLYKLITAIFSAREDHPATRPLFAWKIQNM